MLNQGPPERLPACTLSRDLWTTRCKKNLMHVHPQSMISRNRLKICDFGLCLESNFLLELVLSHRPLS